LASIAGELATDYGITGWEAGEASYGVKECFIQWRADFIVRFKPLAFVASSIPASLNR
jgi:hypothetical protein